MGAHGYLSVWAHLCVWVSASVGLGECVVRVCMCASVAAYVGACGCVCVCLRVCVRV